MYGAGKAQWVIRAYDVYDNTYDWTTDDDIKIPIQQNLVFRVATFDSTQKYKHEAYGAVGSNPINLGNLNYSTYNIFGHSGAYNFTFHDGVVLSVDGDMYDWYQFILQSQNSTTPISVSLIFDNVWTSNAVPSMANIISLMSGNHNDSRELGIAPANFKIKIDIDELTSTELIRYKLNVASYNIQVLTPNATFVPPFESTGVPSWVLPVSIGGGVTIIAIIGGIAIYKKKNPI